MGRRFLPQCARGTQGMNGNLFSARKVLSPGKAKQDDPKGQTELPFS
jgi:hypothetical protein